MNVSVAPASAYCREPVDLPREHDEKSITEAKERLARLVPAKTSLDREARRKLLQAARVSGAAKTNARPSATSSHNFLYDENGLPK